MKNKRTYTSIVYIFSILWVCLVIGIMQSILVLIYVNVWVGTLLIGLILGALVYSFILKSNTKAAFQEDIKQQIDEIEEMQQSLLVNTEMPVLILDSLGIIWWHNNAFQKEITEEELLDKSIRTLFTDIQLEEFPKGQEVYTKRVMYQMRCFEVVCQKVDVKEAPCAFNYIIYFIEKTDEYMLEQQVDMQKPVVGYLCIDSYEEIMKSIEEVRRPMFSAIIERKLNLWFKKNNALVSKYEKDKYILFFTKCDLEKMQEIKFDILDEIRKVQVGNDLPATVSIGIGRNKESILHAKEEAKAAFELAQGRGGDQAVIKNQDKYIFYGGKTKEVEKSARVKARVKAYAYKELLVDADKVYIMGHKNMDMDCLGAAMGVYRAAAIMGKEAYIVLDEPTFAIQALYDRIVESTEYPNLFISKEDAMYNVTNNTLLTIVDVHRKSYLEMPEILDKVDNIVVFDHHRRSTDFIDDAVLTYIETFASSTCEMISEILSYFVDKVKLTSIEADALLAGITIDTKNFVTKAGVRTFEAAAFLRRAGADSSRVRALFQTDIDTYRTRAAAIKDAEVWYGNMAVSFVEGTYQHSSIIAAQVADELLAIKGIEAAFVLSIVNDMVSISARALNDINVQVLMEDLGGGGHKNIAGAQILETDIEQAKDKLKQVIEKYLEEGE